MRHGFLQTYLISFYFLITSAASPRDKYRQEDPEIVNNVGPILSKEPTCDELRAMWRFSKRQSRAAESTNEIPTYRDPFAYNIWEDQNNIQSVGTGKMRRPFVYGRLVHSVIPRPHIVDTSPERIRAFEEVARLFGTNVHISKLHSHRKPTSIRLVGGRDGIRGMHSQGRSFQHLKELIQRERARELHEQKVAEENISRKNALQYQRMMIKEREREKDRERDRDRDRERDRVRDREGERDDINFKSQSRGGQTDEGPVNTPEVLSSSKFNNDLYTNYNYMQRTYPDSLE